MDMWDLYITPGLASREQRPNLSSTSSMWSSLSMRPWTEYGERNTRVK